MKFMHISDLHLGKRVNEFSMLEDQEYILKEILRIGEREQADAMLIAGDVYDKPVPPAEAVQLLDGFLTEAVEKGMGVFLISGNHDSPQRLAFGARLLWRTGSDEEEKKPKGVYLSPVFQGTVGPVELEDEYGPVNIYPVPFIKPAAVRQFFPEREIASYQDAFRAVMESLFVDQKQRNVLVAHQFVTGASRCESEELWVGGMDNVDASLMEAFDYTALGHIHGPQNIGRETVRYCGTPLPYSFSEAEQEKSVTMVELKEKGNVKVYTVPLKPRRKMRKLKGAYEEVTFRENYRGTDLSDYLYITLTDEEDIPGAVERLRSIYPNLMKLDYDNQRTRENQRVTGTEAAEQKTPLQHFEDFYKLRNNQEMNGQQMAFMRELIEKVWEG